MEIKRVGLRMGLSVSDWYEKKAKSLGIPVSALMVMVLADYKESEETLEVRRAEMLKA